MKQRSTLYPRVCQINDSTNLIEVAYDPLDKEMMVTFKDNIKYVYSDISKTLFASIVSAESSGTMFNTTLKSMSLVGVKIDE